MGDKLAKIFENKSVVGYGNMEELLIEANRDTMFSVNIGSDVGQFRTFMLPDGQLGVLANNPDAGVTNMDTAKFSLSVDGKELYTSSIGGLKNVFTKADAKYVRQFSDPNYKDATTLYIQDKLFAGTYKVNGKAVTLNFDGSISGWDLYDSYEVCISGMCWNLCSENSVTLRKKGGTPEGDTFVWAYFSDGLRFYATENTNKADEVPFYKRTKLQYELLR